MNNTIVIRLRDVKQLLRVLVRSFAVAGILVAYFLVFFWTQGNFRAVVAQKVYRSAQPSPTQLKDWVRHHQIRTIISLRDRGRADTQNERELAEQLDVKMVCIPLSAHMVPSADSLAELIQAIETAEQPMLLHCRRGIDRAGTASALAAMAIGKVDYDTAKWQAYIPPGPWKRPCEDNYIHISDMLKLYEDYCRRNGLDTNGWRQFKAWAVDTRALSLRLTSNPSRIRGCAQKGQDFNFFCL